MNKTIAKSAFPLFLLTAALHLAAIAAGYESLRFVTKPLLMPLLALAVYCNAPNAAGKTIILIALLFSFAGDCFLLYDYLYPWFFIPGLVCFLLTHILYILYFFRQKNNSPEAKVRYWFFLPVLVYGAGLLYILFPHLGNLKVPVIVYAFVICSMLMAAIYFYPKAKPAAGRLFITGAILFVASDSMLAINKFMQPFAGASFLIMLTYCSAQFCITKGFLRQAK